MPNESIAITHLLVDTINPRLRNGVFDQPSAIVAVIEANPEKFLDLASHIAKHGLDQSNLPIVIPSEAKDGFFVVVEGNRRLSCLKCLHNPGLAHGALRTSQQKKLATAATTYASRPIRKIECTVYQTRQDAKEWIELRHLGSEDGAAMQAWGPREKRNYAERESGQKAADMQVLDFVKEHGGLSPGQKEKLEKKFNISTLARIVDYDEAAQALGLEITDGVVRLRYSVKHSAKVLRRIVDEIGAGKLPVRKIYTNKAILNYAKNIVGEELPPNTRQMDVSIDLPGASPQKAAGKSKGRSSKAGSKESKVLISRACHLHIPLPKLESVFRELQKIHVDDYPNAVGVLFRVFFETTIDHCLLQEGLKTRSELDDYRLTLPKKAQAVLNHLGAGTPPALSRDERRGLQRSTSTDYFPESITTMHGFVHSKHFMASPAEVRAQWAALQPFIEYVWRDTSAPAGSKGR